MAYLPQETIIRKRNGEELSEQGDFRPEKEATATSALEGNATRVESIEQRRCRRAY